jgi:DNA-directed RNA polymerase specialized sigma24 family protein
MSFARLILVLVAISVSACVAPVAPGTRPIILDASYTRNTFEVQDVTWVCTAEEESQTGVSRVPEIPFPYESLYPLEFVGQFLRQFYQQVGDALSELPELQQRIVLACECERRDDRHVAGELGITAGEVSRLKREALAQLRRAMS